MALTSFRLVGLLACLALSVSVSGKGMQAFTAVPNTQYPGNTLRVLTGAPSAELCGLQCLLDGACRMFEVDAASRTCALKSAVSELPVPAEDITAYIPSGCTPEATFLCKLLNTTSCTRAVSRIACPCTCLSAASEPQPPRMSPVSSPPPVSRPPAQHSPRPRPNPGCDADVNGACKIFGRAWCPFIARECPCLCADNNTTSPATPKPMAGPILNPSRQPRRAARQPGQARPPKQAQPPKQARPPKEAPPPRQARPPKVAPPSKSPAPSSGCAVETTLACQLLDPRLCAILPAIAEGCPCKCSGVMKRPPPATAPPPSPVAEACSLCLTIRLEQTHGTTFGVAICDRVKTLIAKLSELYGSSTTTAGPLDAVGSCDQTPDSVTLCATRAAADANAAGGTLGSGGSGGSSGGSSGGGGGDSSGSGGNGGLLSKLLASSGFAELLAKDRSMNCGGTVTLNLTSTCQASTLASSFQLPCMSHVL